MLKFAQFLIVLSAACLLLAACTEQSPAATPDNNGKPVSPTVESTIEKNTASVPAVTEKSISPTAGTAQAAAVVIKPGKNGNNVTLQVGQTLVIQIPTIPTPGFEWQAQDLDPKILSQVGDPLYEADSSPDAAGGLVTLTFKAVGSGQTTLTLLYVRPSENGIPSLYKNSFGATIQVK